MNPNEIQELRAEKERSDALVLEAEEAFKATPLTEIGALLGAQKALAAVKALAERSAAALAEYEIEKKNRERAQQEARAKTEAKQLAAERTERRAQLDACLTDEATEALSELRSLARGRVQRDRENAIALSRAREINAMFKARHETVSAIAAERGELPPTVPLLHSRALKVFERLESAPAGESPRETDQGLNIAAFDHGPEGASPIYRSVEAMAKGLELWPLAERADAIARGTHAARLVEVEAELRAIERPA